MDTVVVLVEYIKTQIQQNTQVANLYIVYGILAVGLITFSLPQLLNVHKHICISFVSLLYRWFLVISIFCLLAASGIFFWLSRSITLMNQQYSRILFDSALETDKSNYILREIELVGINTSLFVKSSKYTPAQRDHENNIYLFWIKAAKWFGILGLFMYGFVVITFFWIKLFKPPS